MKILHVVSDLYPDVVSGIGIHVHEMAKWQAACGHSVTVFTVRQTNAPPEEKTEGFYIRRFRRQLTVLGNSVSIRLVLAVCKDYDRYDVVHAHSHLFFSTVACSLIRLFKKKPLVVTSHGLLSASAPAWLNVLYTQTVSRMLLRSANRVICLTGIEKENLARLGIRKDNISVIPNGVDTGLFRPVPLTDRKKTGQVAWVGRLVPGKGVDLLIEAFRTVHRKHPDSRLVLVGDGGLSDWVAEAVSGPDLAGCTTWIRKLDHLALPGLYTSSRVFVLPSLMEGMPLTLLEAMSCGIPVVLTEFPHLKDLVRGSGIMVPPGSVKAIAAAICTLLEDDDLSDRLGRHGRTVIGQGYSWKSTAVKTAGVYQEMVVP